MNNSESLISASSLLKQIKDILEEMTGHVVLKNENTFLWTNKDYIFKEYGQLDYRRAMIDAFMKDLREGTKTYIYDVCDKENDSIRDITYFLTQPHRNSEDTFNIQLRLLHLLENPDDFFIRLLELAHHKQNSNFLLNVFKKPMNYGDITNDEEQQLFTCTMYYYGRLVRKYKVDCATVIDSFIHHIKESQIMISEVRLITEFLEVFSENDLPLLFKAFNLDNEDLFVSLAEKSYSKFTLNLITLIVAKLNKNNINHIIETIEKLGLEFPKMVIGHETAVHLELLVENKNSYSEKKVMMLFEYLVSSKYVLREDEKQEFKTIKEFIKQINEVIYLDATIEPMVEKKNKIKV